MGLTNVSFGPVKMSYFKGIPEAFAARGHEVLVTKVHPTAGIERRAGQLKEAIEGRFQDGQKLVIVAHSMGGLDARHMITHMGMASRVAALVTVSAPHRGTTYAAWVLKHFGKRLGGLGLARMLRWDVQAISDLTPEHCARFNERTPDVAGVRYYSISACRPWYQVPPWAMHAWKVIEAAEGANDGLVSVKSAQWGEHLATWAADHWHTINRRFVIERKGRKTGSIVPYYLEAIDRVAGGGD
jgi:triacylglycerol lipase